MMGIPVQRRPGLPERALLSPVSTEKAHTLVVEHTNQGTEVTGGEVGHAFTVHYIVRHPDDCEQETCPISQHVEDVGIEATLGLNHWESGKTVLRHIADGLYVLTYWSRHYSGPNGDDWDAGVDVSSPPEEVTP